jgi:hypothetical protein
MSASAARVERLIALSAGTAARRTRERARAERLIEGLDWQSVADSLARVRLLGALGPRLLELAPGAPCEQFERRLGEALESGRRQGALLALIAQQAIELLADAGIRCSPLKGPLLGEALYGDAGRRSSSDIDLLVEPACLRDAVEVVRRLGYAQPRDRVDEHGLPLLHFALLHERAELPPIELHWRIHWYESRFAQERLLAPASVRALDWRPAAADELAALLLFYARDGFLALRHACDVGAWWDARGGELERGEFDELLAAHAALGPVLRTALAVAGRAVGLPASQIAEIGPRLRARERAAYRLTGTGAGRSEAQRFAQMGLIDGLLAPPGGLRAFSERQLIAPGQAPSSDAAGVRTILDTGHGLRVLCRYALALLGLLRRQRRSHWSVRRAIALRRA